MNFTDINGTRGSFDIVAAPKPATFGLAAFARVAQGEPEALAQAQNAIWDSLA